MADDHLGDERGQGETEGATAEEGRGGADLARQALQQAKADARRRGATPHPGSRGDSRGGSGGSGDRGSRSQTSGGDPLPLASAINELLSDRDWELPAAVASVFARWPQLVGPELAAHTRPESFSAGELVVTADSAAWATQLRLLSSDLARRLRAELGEDSLRKVRVRGPGRPSGAGGSTGISGASR